MNPAIDTPWHVLPFESLPSTNLYVKEHLEQLDNLSVVNACCQTQGRGQRGNKWASSPGENLTFSVLLKFPEGTLDVRRQMRLTALASVAVRDCLRADYGIPARIKWPNDIYVHDRKICGMLIENGLTGRSITHSILGIGLNVNQREWDPALINPTSMCRTTGAAYDRDEVLQCLLRRLGELMPRLQDDCLWDLYCGDLYRLGERHEWADADGKHFYGTIKGVRKDGRLVILCDDGDTRLFAFKEVSYIL